MKYWEEYQSKWGFRNGTCVPPDAQACRHVYVREINRLAARTKSKVRLMAWDRPGVHNHLMIVRVPAELVRGVPAVKLCLGQEAGGFKADRWNLDQATPDKAMEQAIHAAREMNLDRLVETTVSIRGSSVTSKQIDVHCAHCGSRDVRRDADARWNVATQEWELCAVYDSATCEQCGGETSLKEVPLDPLPHHPSKS